MNWKVTPGPRCLTGALVIGATIAFDAGAQNSASRDSTPALSSMPIGSAAENYARYAQTLGLAPMTEWMIRPFSPSTIDLLSSSATTLESLGRSRTVHRMGSLTWGALPVIGSLWYNTTYPFGWNDGAVWRGRGATAAIEGGLFGRWRFLSATLSPQAFIAENRRFGLMSQTPALTNPYAEQPYLDRPQRFGAGSYGQLTPGQSTVRVDALGLGLGVSTANQWIGPMGEWPFLFSNNAAGFPHFFAGSSRPWNIGIGRIHGRVFYGGLSQSAYVNEPDSARGRVVSGIFGSFFPRGLSGLEIGAGRVFHYRWPAGGFTARDYRKPFEAFLKEHVRREEGLFAPNQSADNQLASAFARWAMPRSGIEVYGEFGRDDHNFNGRDAILEPDHIATYGLGLRKGWLGTDGRMTGLRAELLNLDISTLLRARSEGSIYENTYTRQGHTQMGQILGAGFAASSGSGAIVALDRFFPRGERTSVSLTRMVMRERADAPSVDVEYAVAAERTRRIVSFDLTAGLTVVYNMNRYFAANVGNVMLTSAIAW
jgi:hypothetical protein